MAEEKPIKETIKLLFEKIAKEPQTVKKTELMDLWPATVGSFFSKHTRAAFSKDHKVIVTVDDSTAAFELSQRYKATILKRLQNQFGENEITDIKFIVGELH